MSGTDQNPGGGGAWGSTRGGEPGLVASIFDLSFRAMVTPRIVKALFFLLSLVMVLPLLFWVMSSFARSTGAGILALVISPVIYGIGVIMVRIYLELVIIIFRIYETLRDRPL